MTRSAAADIGRLGRWKRFRSRGLIAVGLAASLILAGCGSSSKSTASTASSNRPTYTVGVLTALTGAAAGSNKNILYAVKAGDALAAAEGYNIKYVVADDTSTPAGALAGAQRLVQEDHVLAVISISDLAFAAAPFLKAQGIPVIGGAVDGTEWNVDTNMFSVFGFPNYSKVTTTIGKFFKLVGATTVGAIGYGVVPSSADSAEATGVSAETAGLKVGYIDAKFTLGSTDVGPIVLAVKSGATDGLNVLVQQNTAFAITTGLEQQGVKLKAAVLSDGYGQELISAGPGAMQAAQNAYFEVGWEPVEMHSAATKEFVSYLRGAGFDGGPGLAEYLAYTSFDALVKGLNAAGPKPTHASIIAAMLKISNYNGAGLFGGRTISFEAGQRGLGGSGADGCIWFTRFEGTSFKLVSGADPICGSVIPGKTVSASS